ncbi:MAG: C4-dicarboxylate ABC transporter permease [Hyphomicrobiales bacterium]|nr:TRAP transporter large permease subunit [Hyphomicrobiales bacterium]PCH51660.1 MAG: C4-dicarboxylate ABC transporter permease [Hyphomicrobiales bacterium]
MDIGTISLVLLFGMLFLLAIGMPLGFASGALAGLVLIMKFGPDLLFGTFGTGPLNILAQRMYGITTNYVLISVPLFILMASLLERSGIARDMYSGLSIWLSRTRGGIAIVTSLMAVVMAAMSGIIGGEVVLLGLIALPQMLRLGYNQNLAIGTICASGSLGTMIPPSIVLIFYGLITETSIHALFKGAFVPGFILAGLYITYILVRTHLNPSLAPLPEPSEEDMNGQEKLLYGTTLLVMMATATAALFLFRIGFLNVFDRITPDTGYVNSKTLWINLSIFAIGMSHMLFYVGPNVVNEAWKRGRGMVSPLLVVFVVLGSIYGGITGITEAAGMGCIAVLILIYFRGEFSVGLVQEALMRTFKSTGTIIWVTFGATALAGAYTIAGGPYFVANLILGADLPTLGILFVMMFIFLFLGAFMDWVGIVLLIMPVFLPIVLKLPLEEIGVFSPLVAHPSFVSIWFGILFCVNMQVSFLSPPFGPAAFYLKSVAPPHISLPDIFAGFLPFIGIQLVVLMLILFFPELTMFFR